MKAPIAPTPIDMRCCGTSEKGSGPPPWRAGGCTGAARPRLGAVSFLYRFGSTLNHHVHLHACVTDGVFVPTGDGPPAFLPARPITQADLAALTEKVHRHVVRWFRMQLLLDADAAADMVARENIGFSVDASVRITLLCPHLRV